MYMNFNRPLRQNRLTEALNLVLVSIIARDTDADGPVLDEVHAVCGVPLADDQLTIYQGTREQRIGEVSALVWL